MQEFGPSDLRALAAASGWLELGCPEDAVVELKSISQENQNHPSVLNFYWIVYAGAKKWDEALEVANRLLLQAPESVSGWLNRAYALRRVADGGLEKAWEALLPAAEKFPKEPVVPYNLSCYACQMNRLPEAREWFGKALKAGKRKKIKEMALADSDLQPLWEEIRGM